MTAKDNSSEILVQECLESLGISSLSDWDVLVFLYRHHATLVSAEQIARLLGYPTSVVADALDALESLKLVHRSRASQGVRLYQFSYSSISLPPESCFQQLKALAENRPGRVLLVNQLKKRSGPRINAKGDTK